MKSRLLARAAAAVLVAVLALPVVPALAAGPDAAAPDPVGQAEDRLRAARAYSEDVTARIDAAAALYERANAAAVRLELESADDEAELAVAGAAVASARDDLRARVSDAYKHPFGDSPAAVSGALLQAPDAATALHRAAMLRQVAASAAASVERAERHEALTVHEVTAERVIAAGTAGALRDLRRTSRQLRAELAGARTQVGQAEDALASARATARREAARAAATAAAAARYNSVVPSAPPVITDGRACPVGTPNGFIDSWGFPRSGGRTHEGVDIFADRGTPVYAVGDGTVEADSNTLGGLVIRLFEDNGDRYYYAHLDTVRITQGQRVRAGDVIGTVGNTGNAITTPPHLHWQVHPGGGAAVNPTPLTTALCR